MINDFKILRRLMLCLFDILRQLFGATPLGADERAYKFSSNLACILNLLRVRGPSA